MLAFDSLSKQLKKICKYISVLGVFIVAFVMLLQVILRFVFRTGFAWAEELMCYIMIWVSMLMASVLISNDELIKVDFFDYLWPKRLVKYRDMIYQGIFIFTFIIIIKEGFSQAFDAIDTHIISLNISWFYPYLAIPVGGILLLFQLLHLIISNIFNFNNDNKKKER